MSKVGQAPLSQEESLFMPSEAPAFPSSKATLAWLLLSLSFLVSPETLKVSDLPASESEGAIQMMHSSSNSCALTDTHACRHT